MNTARALGDFELCEVEEIQGVSAGQYSMNNLDDPPPGLVNLDDSDHWATYLASASGHDPWTEQIRKMPPASPHLSISPTDPTPHRLNTISLF